VQVGLGSKSGSSVAVFHWRSKGTNEENGCRRALAREKRWGQLPHEHYKMEERRKKEGFRGLGISNGQLLAFAAWEQGDWEDTEERKLGRGEGEKRKREENVQFRLGKRCRDVVLLVEKGGGEGRAWEG